MNALDLFMACLPELFTIPLYIALAGNSIGKLEHYFELEISGLIDFQTMNIILKSLKFD